MVLYNVTKFHKVVVKFFTNRPATIQNSDFQEQGTI